jgi:hypothetical protein
MVSAPLPALPRLTDDEILALLADDVAPLASPLPSLGVPEPGTEQAADEARRAVMRGRRSLLVRDLARPPSDGSGPDVSPALADLARRLSAGPALTVSVERQRGRWLPGDLCGLAYRSGPAEPLLVEAVSEAGIHSFDLVTLDVLRSQLDSLVQAAVSDGVVQDGSGWLVVSGLARDGRQVRLVVSRDTCTLESAEHDGDATPLDPARTAQVLDALLGSVDVRSERQEAHSAQEP